MSKIINKYTIILSNLNYKQTMLFKKVFNHTQYHPKIQIIDLKTNKIKYQTWLSKYDH